MHIYSNGIWENCLFSLDQQKNLGSKILNPVFPKQKAQKLGFAELIYVLNFKKSTIKNILL